MQNLEWHLADLKSTGKNTMETVEKSLTDMFVRFVRIYPCLLYCYLLLVLYYQYYNLNFIALFTNCFHKKIESVKNRDS